MAKRDWQQEYRRVVGSRHQSTDPAPAPAPDQRQHPRLRPRGLSVEIGVTPGLHLIDLDARSVLLYSDVELHPGQRLSLKIEPAPLLRAQVIDCVAEETDPRLLEVRYRVRCRILPEPAA
jgi:hypothetical protein